MLMTDVAVRAPAIFANSPKPGVSTRYEFLPSSSIINHLTDNGYIIRDVNQRKSRSVDNRAYAKHVIRFRKDSDIQKDDIFPEGILINSHDRTTALTFMMGFFRLVCANGLVVGESVAPPIKFHHSSNNPIDLVLDTLDNQWKLFEDVFPLVNEMRNKELNEFQQHMFASHVNMQFFEGQIINPISDLLKVRRYDDNKNNLWTVYNRIQENMLKGGMLIPNLVNGTKRQTRSLYRHNRAITNIDKTVTWNRELWDMAVDLLKE